ncbi:MAG: ABC transporter ATP-binding protein [Thermoplasmata archaeon]
MSEAEPVVVLEDVEKHFRMRGRDPVRALNGVTLRVERGARVAIEGPSGSGKTTLLQIIGALDTPSSGRVAVEGRDLGALGERELTEYRARTLGFVFQNFYLIPTLSAQENVELAMEARGVPKKDRRRRAADLLRTVEMAHRADHRPSRLSAGEQQRVAIARALANRPSLILADEPTGNLDSETGWVITELLMALSKERGATVIIVTHSAEVSKECDIRLVIRDGRIAGETSPGEDPSNRPA